MKDQLDREIGIESIPAKIVCLVPSLTELLVDLGLEERIVGVTKFCVHPEHIRKTTSVVGGTKTVKTDLVKGLHPDFILANKEENELEDINNLAVFSPVYVSDIKNLENLIELIHHLILIFEIKEKGSNLKESLVAGFKELNRQIRLKPRLKVAYLIWRNPWMAVGHSTFINYLLEQNNFENIFDGTERYPEIGLDDLKLADYVLLSSEPFPFQEKHMKEIPMENSKIRVVDGEFFSWYGSRLIKAFDYFTKLRDNL